MIKGINKQILEVTNTESPYFEKIIFFVKPESRHLGENTLKAEAEKISLTTQKPPKARKSIKQIISTTLYCLMGAGAGVALSYILNNII